MRNKPVYVTQPFLPPLEEFYPYLEEIWENKILTNNGPFHEAFEEALADYLGVKHVTLFSNGTIALLAALKVLDVTGDVITTPYSFVATSHALRWNNVDPIFVDINPATLNLDSKLLEAAKSASTSAILPVHCYGTPCDVERIQKYAQENNLKVIYDAAHAFGVEHKGESLMRHGDVSVLSFHATKVFNTFEGGAVICQSADTKQRLNDLKNFGFQDEVTVNAVGINGKMNEITAAFGLLQLKYIDEVIEKRRRIESLYRERLFNIKGIQLLGNGLPKGGNSSYFPIFVTAEYPISRDMLYYGLKECGFNGRRYFYPLISEMPMYCGFPSSNPNNLPVASRISRQVICLPIFPALLAEQVESICDFIVKASHA